MITKLLNSAKFSNSVNTWADSVGFAGRTNPSPYFFSGKIASAEFRIDVAATNFESLNVES